MMIIQNSISMPNIVAHLQGHFGIRFAEQNKESLLIVLMFDQTAAPHWCQSVYYCKHSALTRLQGK